MDERRTGWVLIVVLVGQLVYLAIQGARAGETRLEVLGLRLLGPLARSVALIPAGFAGAREGVKLRGTLLEENRQLRHEVETLRLRLLQLTDVEGEMQRLGDAVRYPTPPAGGVRAVDIVYADHSSWLRTLILYTGATKARKNQPVLSPDGLVGRVYAVAGSYAKVQLITDRAAGVGGMILRTRRQGVVRGGGQGTRSSSTTCRCRPTCGRATACSPPGSTASFRAASRSAPSPRSSPGDSSSIASRSRRRSTSVHSTRSTCWTIKPCHRH